MQSTQAMGLKEKRGSRRLAKWRRKEEEKMKAGPPESPENMHSYQEENELLKSALAEL